MLKPKIPIAHEGCPFIAAAAFLAVIFAIIGWYYLTAIAVLAAFFITWFFRDPERFVPAGDGNIICPADGQIIVADEVEDAGFTGQKAIKVSIFMNIFNVHVNRIPINGKVEKIIYRPGRFYSADTEKAADHNEYCGVVMTAENGQKLAFVQVAGLIARRIVCWLEQGDEVKAGRRYGLIRFGSRVDLYLPCSARVLVKIGQKVKAGETIIATLTGTGG
ncbi:MAG: phosphatidylserine decarboxylase family protein [Deltaproteobacteria bacterium]|nr:MAG: phosphatidylserine decarboxylase family protein [Deltaproteobacteria bacterium]